MNDKVTSTEVVVVKKDTPAVLPDAKVDEVKVTIKPAEVAEAPEVATIKKQLADAEALVASERTKRIEAEKGREEANTKVVSSQNDAVRAHETAINNAIEVATANLNQIKRDYREAVEGGDIDKQVELQEKLADARWTYKGAEQTKAQFDEWKEKQKKTPAVQVAAPKYTASEQAWIDKHPKFETDDDYYGVVAGADAAARRKGIQTDTKAYYEYIETALKRSGFESNDTAVDNGRDTTGSQDDDDEDEVVVAPSRKPAKAAVSAPVTNAAPNTQRERRATQFKLTPEMQDMAHRMFGPNSSHKLSNEQAENKYAARQMEIKDKRANGEKI